MPRHSCALTLAGIIDATEAEDIALQLDRYGASMGTSNCFSLINHGSVKFFFDSGYPPDGPWRLTPPLADTLEALHVSYCFLVNIDLQGSLGQCQIVDRDLGLEGHFSVRDGQFEILDIAEDNPLRALASRWENVDDYPPLHLLNSQHDALHLARHPGSQTASVTAYMARRAQCS